MTGNTPEHLTANIPNECEECDDLESCKTGPQNCPKGLFRKTGTQWYRFWVSVGVGQTTRDDYKEFPADEEDEVIKGEAKDWAYRDMEGWTKERYNWGYEKVDQPPDDWLKGRIERANSTILSESKNVDRFARMLTEPKEDYEAFKELKTIQLKHPVTGIRLSFNPEGSLIGRTKPLTPVSIRPCAKEYGNKTYLGFYLGSFCLYLLPYHEGEDTLTIMGSNNPAIYVPEFDKIIWGGESWWGAIKSEETLREITDGDINNVWYVRALKAMSGVESKADDPTEKLQQ